MKTEEAIIFCTEYLKGTLNDTDREFLKTAKQALEKQIPKKPRHIDKNELFDGNWVKVCPVCGRKFLERFTNEIESYPRIYYKSSFCDCGQAIDWSEE